ncbi:MAG TPA: NAD(+) diphosphatase [Hyphomonadaceae bacterium]|nr:NAD(+) diphosphatase [Hyphomonadaceae bacterium]HPN05913.1 NAD(+) diphosphatase [Hyphomonadaceae bacterium]
MVLSTAAADIPLVPAGLDRAAHHRRDQAWLDAAFNSDRARVLLMREGLILVEGSAPPSAPMQIGAPLPPGRPLLWLGGQAGMLSPKATRIFLGETEKGSPVFALDMPSSFNLDNSPIAGLGVFDDFRAAAAAFDAFNGGCAATARAIFEWHRRNGFCCNCGARTKVLEAGWKRKCEDCEAEHFPRVDPVAIMLAVKGDKCLLGRQKAWRPGFWSCLAGFVEPGETIEQAAAREIFEEAGIRCTTTADYLFCQPWPFPSSLMIGMILEADNEDIKVDESELETARWFTREETRSMMAGTNPDAFPPMRFAVAHHVIKAWLERG